MMSEVITPNQTIKSFIKDSNSGIDIQYIDANFDMSICLQFIINLCNNKILSRKYKKKP